jgi:hypothetical protein
MLDLPKSGRRVLLAILLGGCGTASSPADVAPGSGGTESIAGTGGAAGGAAGSAVVTGGGGAGGMGGTSVAPAITSKVLPTLPGMSNVNVIAGDHHVTVTFDPVDAAKDYRIYALPADGDVLVDAGSGKLTGVKNATYRCAGTHEAADIAKDASLDPHYNNCEEFAIVDSSKPYVAHCGTGTDCFPTAGGTGNHFGQGGYARLPSETQLGYVYTTPGAGRAAVHALGDSSRAGYYECSHHGWATSRAKKYSTDPAEWSKLQAAGWLDLGVQFYVPMTADATTQPLYTASLPAGAAGTQKTYYFLSGAEYDLRKKAAQTIASAFSTLKAAPAPNADGSASALPLYRVLYSLGFATAQHDELAVGKARFDNLYGQGQDQQNFQITYSWSGEAPQNLVLEALDGGCPFQGNIGEKSIAPTDLFKQWFKLDEIRGASTNGEVFLNGHAEPATSRPNPIARAYITGTSATRPAMDFQSHYEATPEVFTPVVNGACGAANFNCDAGTLHALSSANFDITFNGIDGDRWSVFNTLGQLWTAYSDSGADTAGQLRMTAKPTATMTADTFLHASMEVTTMSSARRYPQIIISDQVDTPAWISTRQGTAGKFIVLQPINDWPTDLQVQVCANRAWAVNDQCPHFDMFHVSPDALPPVLEMAERASEDGLNRFEIYASTSRAYVFFDGQPYGCAKFDPATIPSGNVKVTFGDVVYHTGVDNEFVEVLSNGFHNKQKLTFGERHFGSLGFSSKVAAPMWDEAKIPCATTAK